MSNNRGPSQTRSSERLTKPQISAWLTAFAGWLFDYYEIALMTFLVVPISAEFDLTKTQSALLLSLQLLGIAVGGVIFGYLDQSFQGV